MGRFPLQLLQLSLLLCSLLHFCVAANVTEAQAMQQLRQLLSRGEMHEILRYTENLEAEQPEFVREFESPHQVYHFRAVAGERTANYTVAAAAYEKGLEYKPDDETLLIKLAEIHAMYLHPNKAIALIQPLMGHRPDLLTKLYRYKSWSCHWDNVDTVHAGAQRAMHRCIEEDDCKWLLATESPLAPGRVCAYANTFASDNDQHALLKLLPESYAPTSKRLKIGFISSDFGVHPVSSLVRGMLQMIDRDKFEVFCFSVTSETSWWRSNITGTVEHFYDFAHMSTKQAAEFIAAFGVNILIDLNGRTRHSGLNIMAYRPAPLQVSFLGLPTTTATAFIDYFLVDWVASPPAEDVLAYSEKLILMPPCYIVNDYAQVRGRFLERERADPSLFKFHTLTREGPAVRNTGPLVSTLSNFMKIDQLQWIVWMNILRSVPDATFVLTEFSGHEDAIPNLAEQLPFFGVNERQVLSTPQQPWIHHVWMKSAFDLMLDTWSKNGHTTGQDPIWAGVPAVTMHGDSASRRSSLSIAAALGRADGVTFSLKEYEDLAIELLRNPVRREALRQEIKRLRTQTRLFHTRYWTNEFMKTLQGLWEQFQINNPDGPFPGLSESAIRAWHKDFAPRPTPHPHQYSSNAPNFVGAVDAPILSDAELASPGDFSFLSDEMWAIVKAANHNILLNVGGISKRAGWINVNAKAGPGTHLEADMSNLRMFPGNSVTAIYSSHTFEHVPFRSNASAFTTLQEWHRVLRSGGRLMIAVPNIRVLATAILDDALSLAERMMVLKMVYGAQTDEYDFHYAGYDFELLSAFLTSANFCEIEEVESFGLFADTSTLTFRGYQISLNVVAKACNKHGPEVDVGIPLVKKRPGA